MWRRNQRFLCSCKFRQSAGHLCSLRSVSWCNLAKSYIFGFLLDWRARWYETVVTNIIFSWDGEFSPSFFSGVNIRRTGEFHLKIIFITVGKHSRRKNFNCAKITKVILESYKVSCNFETYFGWVTPFPLPLPVLPYLPPPICRFYPTSASHLPLRFLSSISHLPLHIPPFYRIAIRTLPTSMWDSTCPYFLWRQARR